MSTAVLQAAYVLHCRPYRESSQLIELFCAEAGRISVVARGSRRHSSGLKALLQPFMPLQVSWQGRSELKTLISAELRRPPLSLRDEALYSGLYLNELLYYLLDSHTAYPGLFANYDQVLGLLATLPAAEPVLRQFELQLLDELGYGVEFEREADSGLPIEPEGVYLYRAEYGFVRYGLAGRRPDLFRGVDLQAMARRRFDDLIQLQAAKRFCRQALHPLLGNRPLKSRELFQQLAARKKQ
ncbi:DNA repair protein RecO [Pseudaeromonas sharmana]|uniref:DNA repair protein RecO n=1 Tax=Pseudaeromonas sharmana TaxID=328412 RepID=A0ABV8CMB1_9GAMM